ncbi:hypothetical protein JWJ88_11655 (plasmid) [Paracoccus methylovorus]|uniref:Uncharacterized protein n=1 Tax=Paracoccus methylovorus TaxID=2812658 RepID=A0ABX7JL57_9RHOB|nr:MULTISPECIES: hypothetical protein [Paracoccus]QRZ14539.1 hypothetical protein JWJ88_11655 [Paracoccus methylovorus]
MIAELPGQAAVTGRFRPHSLAFQPQEVHRETAQALPQSALAGAAPASAPLPIKGLVLTAQAFFPQTIPTIATEHGD